MKENIEDIATLIFTIGTIIAISVFIFTALGSQPKSLQYSDRTAIIQPCDTDTDCLEKNGCGGYGNPCEEK